jgi:hypothetical protein
MEYFVIAGGIYLLSAALISRQAGKFNRSAWATFLMAISTTPFGAYLFLREGKKTGIKRTKKRGPWTEWIAKAEHLQSIEHWENAQEAYYKALNLLEEGLKQGSYNEKYLKSKVSEINYALDLIDAQANDTTKVVKLGKHQGLNSEDRMSKSS